MSYFALVLANKIRYSEKIFANRQNGDRVRRRVRKRSLKKEAISGQHSAVSQSVFSAKEAELMENQYVRSIIY